MITTVHRCWRCDTVLTQDNNSNEHILLNACGGRLKSKWLLCQKCNSLFGNKFDNELASQVNDVMNYLMVPRERKAPQPIVGKLKSDGTEYKHLASGDLIKSKPEVKIETEGDQVRIYVAASNDEQFNEVIKGLVRKYPVLNKDDILKQAQRSKYYLNEPMHSSISIGGAEAFKSIAKAAINYYIFKGGEAKYIKGLIPYLEGSQKTDVVWYYFTNESPFVPNENEVSHIIKLVGNTEEQILYAYIELFNYMNVLVLLNPDYTGTEINETYAFELTTLKEFDADVKIKLSRKQLLDHFSDLKVYHHRELLTRMNRTMLIADAIQTKFHLNKLIESEVKKAFKGIPEGTNVTRQEFSQVLEKVSEAVVDFFAHQENRTQFRRRKED